MKAAVELAILRRLAHMTLFFELVASILFTLADVEPER